MLRMNSKGQKVEQGGQLDDCNAIGECGRCRGSRVAAVETEMWVNAGQVLVVEPTAAERD